MFKIIVKITALLLFAVNIFASQSTQLTELNKAQEINAEVKTGQFLGSKQVEKMPSWFKSSFLDLLEDIEEVKEQGKHLIIYFHQNGCPYCAKLVEENFTNKQLVQKIRKNFEIIDINMWGNKELTDFNGKEFSEKEYSAFLQVQFTPTLMFFDTNGNIVLRMDGYQSIKKMDKILDYVANKIYKKQSFADFINPENNDSLNSQSFFNTPPHLLMRSEKHPASQFLAVFFETGNCKECDDFHTNMLSKDNIISAFKQMEVVQLNISTNQKLINTNGEKTTSKKWYQDLKLTSTPAIVFFDKNGKEIIRKDGFFKEFHFDSILQYVSTKAYKTQPNFQRYIEHRADEIRATGKDVDLWQN